MFSSFSFALLRVKGFFQQYFKCVFLLLHLHVYEVFFYGINVGSVTKQP